MSGDNDGDIEIKSKSGFRATLSQLGQVHEQIPVKKADSEGVRSAAESAASNGEAGAPIFTAVLAALGEALKGLGDHIDAADSSVGSALADLTSLVDGMEAIDDDGAAKVRES